MNAKTNKSSVAGWLISVERKRRPGAISKWRLMMPVLLGLLLLSLAGCYRPVKVVEVDRPVFLEPPAMCLAPVEWDQGVEPVTNGQLWDSWLSRGWSLEVADGMLQCIREWAADTRRAFRTTGSPGDGR